MSLLLTGLRSSNAPGGPFEPPLGTLAFLGLFATPGLVGFVATVGRQRALFIPAGVGCMAFAVIAFSGVTLPLLIPGVCFLLLAGERGASDAANADPRSSRAATTLLAVVGAVGTLVALVTAGVFGAVFVGVALPLAAQVVRRRRSRGSAETPRRRALTAATALTTLVVLGLILSAAVALFATTDTVCWVRRDTPAGAQYQLVPESQSLGPIGGSTGLSGAGCDSGTLSLRGSLAGLALDASAVAVSLALALRASGGRTALRRA